MTFSNVKFWLLQCSEESVVILDSKIGLDFTLLKILFSKSIFQYLLLNLLCSEEFTLIPQNGQTQSSKSSANSRQIVWVCLTILWGWHLKGLTFESCVYLNHWSDYHKNVTSRRTEQVIKLEIVHPFQLCDNWNNIFRQHILNYKRK